MKHNPICFASYMGEWAIDPVYLKRATAAIVSGMHRGADASLPHAHAPALSIRAATAVPDPASDPDQPEVMYVRTDAGTAVIQMTGAMMKARSKFGGISTVDTRRYIRAALTDPEVGALLLAIDSPGGTVSGTQALADEIRAADRLKPIVAHIEDLGASAGFWAASQARRVTANRSALVGSLGTYGVIEDTSKRAQADGVTVHVISTGAQKGAFVDGAPITPAQLAAYQTLIDDLNGLFMRAVQEGRRLTSEQTSTLFDGRVHIAEKALALGLIDSILSFDQALTDADALARHAGSSSNKRRVDLARARR